MKISVIVTVYNRLEYLKNIIKSLKSQNKMPYELIIADDGSSENIFEYIENEFEECLFRIKHVYQRDIGFRLARSRNNGARESEGDYLVFLDQDCIIPKDFLEIVEGHARKGTFIPYKVIWSSEKEKHNIQKIIDTELDYNKIISQISIEKLKKLKKIYRQNLIKNFKYYLKLKDRGTNIIGAAFSMYKEDYVLVNGFNEEYINWGKEDDDISWRLYNAGVKSRPILLPKPIIHMYHYSDPSKNGDLNEKFFLKIRKNINKENFKCKYGYFNIKDNDPVTINVIE
jgi:glycosyltransferase involved in cell wall biosynthesis